ncbi:hypothetical protein FOXG_18884 [Fusarium oxysporum f. sp. lycopersici 4287]|uniref:Uncharacterized protein n=2 Tax=Fusarium oxysporum TaxID=5507 RepID=A0A0J9UR44_FUSO4|nr:hypothetical protein FOXG_18884 [Fusarium oxysporum f. sp. lycopersici 4287]EXK43438.1 hypothetical protein FOMG_02395 [Fusarium oxysporum f. sp. melonis 26406]KNB01448.1 hypothetical protein FOXG_18884 [Fusarium oxysporum f. sp. lycopersici 4287]
MAMLAKRRPQRRQGSILGVIIVVVIRVVVCVVETPRSCSVCSGHGGELKYGDDRLKPVDRVRIWNGR